MMKCVNAAQLEKRQVIGPIPILPSPRLGISLNFIKMSTVTLGLTDFGGQRSSSLRPHGAQFLQTSGLKMPQGNFFKFGQFWAVT